MCTKIHITNRKPRKSGLLAHKKAAICEDGGVHIYLGVGCGGESKAIGMHQQNHSPLPPPIHHLPEVRGTTTPNLRTHPSTQFAPDSATSPSNPGPASKRHEPRSFNREMLSVVQDSRSVDHRPTCLDLGRRTMVQARLQVRF